MVISVMSSFSRFFGTNGRFFGTYRRFLGRNACGVRQEPADENKVCQSRRWYIELQIYGKLL